MTYRRHQRYRNIHKIRYSRAYWMFLKTQATRLNSTAMHIFKMLNTGYSSIQIAALSTMPSGGSEVTLPVVTGFDLVASETTVTVGSEVTLYVTNLQPWNGDTSTFTAVSGTPANATVTAVEHVEDAINVIGVKAGKSTITVTVGSIIKTIDITVQ